jgi:hypothetical protein
VKMVIVNGKLLRLSVVPAGRCELAVRIQVEAIMHATFGDMLRKVKEKGSAMTSHRVQSSHRGRKSVWWHSDERGAWQVDRKRVKVKCFFADLNEGYSCNGSQ